MTLRNQRTDLGYYANKDTWSKLRNIYEARQPEKYLRLSPFRMDKKIMAQMPKGFMAIKGTIMIGPRPETMYSAYLPRVLHLKGIDQSAHNYDVLYTIRKPGKVTTFKWLKHIGKELGYEIIPA